MTIEISSIRFDLEKQKLTESDLLKLKQEINSLDAIEIDVSDSWIQDNVVDMDKFSLQLKTSYYYEYDLIKLDNITVINDVGECIVHVEEMDNLFELVESKITTK